MPETLRRVPAWVVLTMLSLAGCYFPKTAPSRDAAADAGAPADGGPTGQSDSEPTGPADSGPAIDTGTQPWPDAEPADSGVRTDANFTDSGSGAADAQGGCEAGACTDGEVCNAGQCGLDREWAEWPIPPDSPVALTVAGPTVQDGVTGLVWQGAVPAPLFAWPDARAYCAGLDLAGHTDWRLPTLIELSSIVDSGRSGPAVNPAAFPATPSEYFWSSSSLAGDPGNAWRIDFAGGSTSTGVQGDTHRARCVR